MASLTAAASAMAQTDAPVVSPRGVVNTFTQQPAPSVVAQGGIIWITGLNLGPAEGVKAAAAPLPTKIGEPGTEVLVNGRNAPIFSATPTRIVAQIPYETNPGLANVFVRRGEQQSRPARINVVAMLPSVQTKNGLGYGEIASDGAATLTLGVAGLGITEPRVGSGEAPAADAPSMPRASVYAYVGGLPANVSAQLSKDRVGEFDVRIEAPTGAAAGDLVSLVAGGRLSNQGTLGKSSAAAMKYLKMPPSAPEIRGFLSSDLRGSYLLANGARDSQGCYGAFLFDFAKEKVTPVDGCMTTALANAATPFVNSNDSATVAAFVGPPESGTAVSARVQVFNPVAEASMTATLPAAASLLLSGEGGNFIGVITGQPARAVVIDARSGEVSDVVVTGAAVAGPIGAGGPLLGGFNLNVDLGGGLNKPLSAPQGIQQNQRLIVVGDDTDNPKAAKVAVINPQNEPVVTRDFPEGWLPLAAPGAATAPGGGQRPGGAAPVRLPVTTFFDGPTRVYYVLSRKADGSQHGFATFTLDDAPAKAVPMPEGWFAASCVQQIPIAGLELSRRFGMLGSRTAATAFANPCPAQGFILMDLTNQTPTATALPGAGQFNASAGADEMNDYMFGQNTDPAQRNIADTLYILDGVTAVTSRIDLPAGITGFGAVSRVPALNWLIAPATRTTQGDSGLVIFDLDTATSRVLPVPEGFATVQSLGVFNATRKLLARGVAPANAGTQFLIYDLISGDLAIIANPAGVAFVGPPPAQAPAPGGGGPGQPQQQAVQIRVSQKSNSVEALAFDSARRQTGIVSLKVN